MGRTPGQWPLALETRQRQRRSVPLQALEFRRLLRDKGHEDTEAVRFRRQVDGEPVAFRKHCGLFTHVLL